MKIKLVDVVLVLGIAGFLASMIYAIGSVKEAQQRRNEIYCIDGASYNQVDGGYIETSPPRKCISGTK